MTGPSVIQDAVRRHRGSLLVAVLVVLAGVAGALTIPSGTEGALDPRSATGPGSRAVAQVLRAHGVRVDLAQRSNDAVSGAGAGATIVVVDTTLLGPRQLDRLAAARADLVLVEPDLITLQALAPQLEPAGSSPDRSLPPGCDDPDAVAAGVVTAGGRLYRVAPDSGASSLPGRSGITRCYPRDGVATTSRDHTVMRLVAGGHQVTVLGQSAVLRNESLADAGNAALALRVLGARPQLRWYLPDPAELIESGGAPTLSELLPSWVWPVVWQLGIAVVIALLWRSRRLGRLVTEPLPVVVRSAETQEGRARLYRQAGARDLAAATLRTAVLRRLAVRLSVPGSADPQVVVHLAAAASARPESDLRDIMLGGPPADDAALVRLAAALDTIEHQVTGSPGRRPPRQAEEHAEEHPADDSEVGTR
jgi:hypothetical protein